MEGVSLAEPLGELESDAEFEGLLLALEPLLRAGVSLVVAEGEGVSLADGSGGGTHRQEMLNPVPGATS